MKRSEAEHNRHLPPPQRQSLTRLVDRVPLLPRPHFPGWTGHPVPVAFGEVSKLCDVEQGRAVRNPEPVPVLGPWPVTIEPTPDSHRLPSGRSIEALLAELDPASRRVFGLVCDLVFELVLPAHEVDRGLHGSDPAQLASGFASNDQGSSLVGFRHVSRDG